MVKILGVRNIKQQKWGFSVGELKLHFCCLKFLTPNITPGEMEGLVIVFAEIMYYDN